MIPAKIFLESKFSYFTFSNPSPKTKTGTLQIGGKLLKPNPPRLIKLSSQSTAGVCLALRLLPAIYLDQSNYLANQQQVFGFVVPFTSNLPGTIKLFIQSTAGVWLAVPFTSLHKLLQ